MWLDWSYVLRHTNKIIEKYRDFLKNTTIIQQRIVGERHAINGSSGLLALQNHGRADGRASSSRKWVHLWKRVNH